MRRLCACVTADRGLRGGCGRGGCSSALMRCLDAGRGGKVRVVVINYARPKTAQSIDDAIASRRRTRSIDRKLHRARDTRRKSKIKLTFPWPWTCCCWTWVCVCVCVSVVSFPTAQFFEGQTGHEKKPSDLRHEGFLLPLPPSPSPSPSFQPAQGVAAVHRGPC